jgi:hypothetical protein
MASAFGSDGSDVIFNSSGVGCCQSAAKAVAGMDRHRREKGKNEKDRDRRRTGTSNNGRNQGNDYIKRGNAQGMAGDVIPCPFAVDKDYLDPGGDLPRHS